MLVVLACKRWRSSKQAAVGNLAINEFHDRVYGKDFEYKDFGISLQEMFSPKNGQRFLHEVENMLY